MISSSFFLQFNNRLNQPDDKRLVLVGTLVGKIVEVGEGVREELSVGTTVRSLPSLPFPRRPKSDFDASLFPQITTWTPMGGDSSEAFQEYVVVTENCATKVRAPYPPAHLQTCPDGHPLPASDPLQRHPPSGRSRQRQLRHRLRRPSYRDGSGDPSRTDCPGEGEGRGRGCLGWGERHRHIRYPGLSPFFFVFLPSRRMVTDSGFWGWNRSSEWRDTSAL